jgi:hypothetical protein
VVGTGWEGPEAEAVWERPVFFLGALVSAHFAVFTSSSLSKNEAMMKFCVIVAMVACASAASINIAFGKGSGHVRGTKCACIDTALNSDETLTFPAQIDKTNWLSTHSNGDIRTNSDTFTATVSPGGTCTDSQTYICCTVSKL